MIFAVFPNVVSTSLWGLEPVKRQAWVDRNMTNPRENFSEKKTAVRQHSFYFKNTFRSCQYKMNYIFYHPEDITIIRVIFSARKRLGKTDAIYNLSFHNKY